MLFVIHDAILLHGILGNGDTTWAKLLLSVQKEKNKLTLHFFKRERVHFHCCLPLSGEDQSDVRRTLDLNKGPQI